MILEKLYSLARLRKSKRFFHAVHRLYKRKEKSLRPDSQKAVSEYLALLHAAIEKKDPIKAKVLCRELRQVSHRHLPKSSFDKIRDFTASILFALAIAVLVRTMWFELYTIPTGSMRPTLKENDYLVVSKTDYGINVPLKPKHFYFDESLVQRGSIVVFNGANMDIADNDTMYFFLFPGKKQFVKRLLGKPGDTLYFYGGQIYGIDKAGKEIEDFRKLQNLEHIPFIRLDGKVDVPHPAKKGVFSPVIISQMNQPVAKLFADEQGNVRGELIPLQGNSVSQYSDFLGMKNFAMARLLTKEQMRQIYPDALPQLEAGVLYLDLLHHPQISGAKCTRDEYNRLRPDFAISHSFIPLQSAHLDTIAKHMTTCRFTVKNGQAFRFGLNPHQYGHYLPKMADVPDGTYEIQDGVVYKLPVTWLPLFGGISYKVAPTHPLYNKSTERIQMLYNLGIEFFSMYAPLSKEQKALPSRYAYFKDGSLYLLGANILSKNDPTLIQFHQREMQKASPFMDHGAPTIEEIRKNGIRIPEKMYLALGDNHAMSADSRQFGFIPEDNLKGGVSFLFSPPGPRWGQAPQPAQPHWTFPNIAIWSAFILISCGYTIYMRKKWKKLNPLDVLGNIL